MLVFTS